MGDLVASRTLIACLGNIFLGDDGFGVEVARRLAGEDLPAGTRLTDYGIRGMHLAYDLADGWDTTILVDAAQQDGQPGTLYLIEPEPRPVPRRCRDSPGPCSSTRMACSPTSCSAWPEGWADAGRVLVVGCEPATPAEGIGLSEPVSAAGGRGRGDGYQAGHCQPANRKQEVIACAWASRAR